MSCGCLQTEDRPLLQIEGLSVSFKTASGNVRAAEDVSFDLRERETLALMGETGCGKSVVASAIMQLLPSNASVHGKAIYAKRDLLALNEKQMAEIRGSEISIIFQNPSLALNPIMQVAEQISEMLRLRKGVSTSRSTQLALEMASHLGLSGRDRMRMYPFQFSGGMNQRVMIAASLMLSPRIIIADEPSKALDASTSGEVMAEMMRIKKQTGSALLLITHDLKLAREISDRTAVMYCGEIVEMGDSKEIFSSPMHPYTEALFGCLPERGFQSIPGVSPSMIDPPAGCRFHPRCQRRREGCDRKPGMVRIRGRRERHECEGLDCDASRFNCGSRDRVVRCWRY